MHQNLLDKKLKVLYIAGWGRSGSTLLADLLGNCEGFFCAGEFRLWARRYRENYLCGCGTPIRNCRVWGEILDQVFGSRASIDINRMHCLFEQGLGLVDTFSMIRGKEEGIKRRKTDYIGRLGRIFRSIQRVTDCRVIIDASKFPPYGYGLMLNPSLEVYVVHLVRDPRAVAYSWYRQRFKTIRTDDPLYRRRLNAFQCATRWLVSNFIAESLKKHHPHRYTMLRYEDFIQQPRRCLKSILDFVGEKTASLAFLQNNRADISKNHSVSGNPGRFSSMPLVLQIDDEWKFKMGQPTKAMVTALTWPLLLRYGYMRSAGKNRA